MDKDFWDDEDEQLYSYVILGLLVFEILLFFINTLMIIKINNRINELNKRDLEVHEYILNRIGG